MTRIYFSKIIESSSKNYPVDDFLITSCVSCCVAKKGDVGTFTTGMNEPIKVLGLGYENMEEYGKDSKEATQDYLEVARKKFEEVQGGYDD